METILISLSADSTYQVSNLYTYLKDTSTVMIKGIANSNKSKSFRIVSLGDLSGKADISPDIEICSNYATNAPIGNVVTELFGKTRITAYRTYKRSQREQINYIVKAAKDFIHHISPVTFNSVNTVNENTAKVALLKPSAGARGIGLCFFPTKLVNAVDLLETLRHAREQFDEESLKTVSCEDANRVIQDSLNERFSGRAVVWSSEKDRTPLEGLNCLLGSDGSVHIEEYIPNVRSEYRVIVGANNKACYALERQIVKIKNGSTEVQKASGEFCGIESSVHTSHNNHHNFQHDALEFLSSFPEECRSEFNRFLSFGDFALFAFDLFVTEDNKWGIFELSPDSGTHSVPNGLLYRESIAYVANVAENSLSI